MMKLLKAVFSLLYIGMVMSAGCAGRQPAVSLAPHAGESRIAVKASNFKFEPNNVVVQRGAAVLFAIENTAGSAHNFSIKSPSEKIILSLELPAAATQQASVTFTEPGIYEIYCDKTFHSALGMKGQIEVK